MPSIQVDLGNIGIGNNPSAGNVSYVDLSYVLSEKYGKMIRQGHNFTITGIQARLRPTNAGYDVGMAVSGSMGYMPTTKHSRRAWNQAFQMWKKQKQLGGVVGSTVKHDDLEFCYQSSSSSGRTSTIFSQGMGDQIGAKMGLFGASSESGLEQYFSLTDFYDSNNPVDPPSVHHWSGATIKDAKFQNKMPDAQYNYFSSTATTVFGDNPTTTSLTDDALSGAIVQTDIMDFPVPAQALAGLLKFTTYILPDDTDTQNEGDDKAQLEMIIYIKKWSPLAYKPRRKARRKSMYRSRARRFSGSRSRRKYRGRRRS